MKFGEILKGAEDEGEAKHVPVIEIEKEKGRGGEDVDTVRVIVGKEVPHPNTVEHHIAWVELYGVKKNGQVIHLGRADFAPAYTDPDIGFKVPLGDFKALCALEYCNIHGVWENCVELK